MIALRTTHAEDEHQPLHRFCICSFWRRLTVATLAGPVAFIGGIYAANFINTIVFRAFGATSGFVAIGLAPLLMLVASFSIGPLVFHLTTPRPSIRPPRYSYRFSWLGRGLRCGIATASFVLLVPFVAYGLEAGARIVNPHYYDFDRWFGSETNALVIVLAIILALSYCGARAIYWRLGFRFVASDVALCRACRHQLSSDLDEACPKCGAQTPIIESSSTS